MHYSNNKNDNNEDSKSLANHMSRFLLPLHAKFFYPGDMDAIYCIGRIYYYKICVRVIQYYRSEYVFSQLLRTMLCIIKIHSEFFLRLKLGQYHDSLYMRLFRQLRLKWKFTHKHIFILYVHSVFQKNQPKILINRYISDYYYYYSRVLSYIILEMF